MAESKTTPNPYRRSLLRQERSRQTRDALVHAALGLWRERGFDDTTIDDISAAAGVARATYYFHFPDKEALCDRSGDVGVGDRCRGREEEHRRPLTRRRDAGSFELRDTSSEFHALSRITLSSLGGIGHLGEGGNIDAGFGGQLGTIFERKLDELVPGTDPVELGAIAAGMVMEGILRWSLGTARQQELRDVISERMTLILDGARLR
jgi:AcrR family transcriptional regulator